MTHLYKVDGSNSSRIRAWLLSREGGSVNAIGMASLLNVEAEEVAELRNNGSLLAYDLQGQGVEADFTYPVWQVDLMGLDKVLAAMSQYPMGMTQISFLLNPSYDLNGLRPIDALRRGRLEDVLRALMAREERISQ